MCLSTGKCLVVILIFYNLIWEQEYPLFIHYALMVKTTKIIAYHEFGECICKIVIGVYLPHLHNIVRNMIPKKMVARLKRLFFRVIPGLVKFNTTIRLSTNIGVGLQILILINIR